MNSGYGEDLFQNGWAASTPEQRLPYALSPSLPNSLAMANTISTKVPPQYKTLYDELNGRVASVTELEATVFEPLIAHHLLSAYQSSRIIDTMYDNNILPPNTESNFYQILGLLALELEVSGSGDFVTLQFRLNSGLPPLPQELYDLLVQTESQQDQDATTPLAALLGNIAIEDHTQPSEPEWPSSSPIENPLMADHSALLIDPDTSVTEPVRSNAEAYVKKYITDLRDQFLPLVGLSDSIRIKEVPEKEGLLFKHINYTIMHELNLGVEGSGSARKVIRRYSDFVWLLEFLLKKYPLRVIPGLPPKKFTGMSILRFTFFFHVFFFMVYAALQSLLCSMIFLMY